MDSIEAAKQWTCEDDAPGSSGDNDRRNCGDELLSEVSINNKSGSGSEITAC